MCVFCKCILSRGRGVATRWQLRFFFLWSCSYLIAFTPTADLQNSNERDRHQMTNRLCKPVEIEYPGTTPITILAVTSDHGLSFAGEGTQTMVSEFPFLYRFTVLLNSGGSMSFGLNFLILWGWGWFPHRQVEIECSNRR